MTNVIRRLFNRVGLDVSRAYEGRPKWSGIADDYYPINVRPRWGHGRGSHPQIANMLNSNLDQFINVLLDLERTSKHFPFVPDDEGSLVEPYWNNNFFSTLDGAALMYFVIKRRPRSFLEIGSGFSTKFAKAAAVSSGSAKTAIISIDPNPRTEIDKLCDKIIRAPLEDVDLTIFDQLEAGDIVFFDGSHRVFTNSDTTVFYLEVLPRLKSGILVHVHDVFWPDDYIPEWNRRLYSEQYIIAAMMLGGMGRYKIVLPNYFLSMHPSSAPIIGRLGIPERYPGTSKPGLSFWFEVV